MVPRIPLLLLSALLTGIGFTSCKDPWTMNGHQTLDLDGELGCYNLHVSGEDNIVTNGKLFADVDIQDGELELDIEWDVPVLGEVNSVVMNGNATLDLASRKHVFELTVTGTGNTLKNGSFTGNLTLMEGSTLYSNGGIVDGAGPKSIVLNNGSTLTMGGDRWISDISTLQVNGTATLDNALLRICNGYYKLDNGVQNLVGNNDSWICLGDSDTLDLNGYTLNLRTLLGSGHAATIQNGEINSFASIETNAKLTLENVAIRDNATFSMGSGAMLDLGGSQARLGALEIEGSVTVENGTLLVERWDTLTLSGNLGGTGGVTLEGNSSLNLNNATLSKDVTASGNASIGGGTLNGALTIGADTLTLCGDLVGSGAITLGDNSNLNLSTYTLSNPVALEGNATIGNGTLNSALTVGSGKTLTLSGNLGGTGGVTLEGNSTLNLNNATLSNSVTLTGDATIGNGTLNSALTVIDGKTLTLSGNLMGKGTITLGDNANLNLCKHELSKSISLEGNATIGNGMLYSSTIKVPSGKTLTLSGNLAGSGSITLENGSTLNLNNALLAKGINVKGDASIGGGTLDCVLLIRSNCTLTLIGNLKGLNSVDLYDSTLNLNNATLSKHVTASGNAGVGGGTLDGVLTVSGGSTLTLNGNLAGTGSVTLEGNSTLNLNNATLSKDVTATGNATIGNGELNSALTVGSGKTLTLCGDLEGTGGVTLEDGSTLNLNNATLSTSVTASGNAGIGGGTLDGELTVSSGKTLTLSGNLRGTGSLTLENGSTLNLGGHTLSRRLSVLEPYGNATIGNGVLEADLAVLDRATLTLSGDLMGSGNITLWRDTRLNLNNATLSTSVTASGNASIGGGTLDGYLTVNSGRTTLSDNLTVTCKVYLSSNTTLDLNNATLSTSVSAWGNASIGGGTLNGALAINSDKTLTLIGNLSGEGSISLGNRAKLQLSGYSFSGSIQLDKESSVAVNASSTITAREGADSATLEKVSVSAGQITGMDRQSSLADGLCIESEADLLIESMTITANNEIHVGEHTITLKDVTIKMSDDICEPIESTFYFNLQSLINCELVMENVLLDASNLTLPEGFDPANKSVVFDFGDDVTIKQATGLDMRLGNYWSPSLNLDQPGKVIFTKLVETPEPTTGTLGLLALAALAARRRKK